jgi:hypothetical protein
LEQQIKVLVVVVLGEQLMQLEATQVMVDVVVV